MATKILGSLTLIKNKFQLIATLKKKQKVQNYDDKINNSKRYRFDIFNIYLDINYSKRCKFKKNRFTNTDLVQDKLETIYSTNKS
jgi:hypothetical protein